jgi:two-component sensor histidine kinase
LQVQYETAKKEKDIKLLSSQNQLQRIRGDEAIRTRNIMLAGVALLLIIVALLFNRYTIKRRSNQRLEAHQRELDQQNSFLETLNSEKDKLLEEKEWLIREVHHRVKNNLQMVTSLLRTQSAYLDNDVAVLAVKDSFRRMQAMSLIHQKLYMSKNISSIDMPEYINELVSYLRDSFDTENKIIFQTNIEPLTLDVSQAVPLGLIINESIVNSIKYAFLNGQKGTVNIGLQCDSAGHLLLNISDNGIGLPETFDMTSHNSLGLDLIRGLAKQLNATLEIKSNNGMHITIGFVVKGKEFDEKTLTSLK